MFQKKGVSCSVKRGLVFCKKGVSCSVKRGLVFCKKRASCSVNTYGYICNLFAEQMLQNTSRFLTVHMWILTEQM